jgi:uncharacterized membrane protein YbhN (UPF0104 family)
MRWTFRAILAPALTAAIFYLIFRKVPFTRFAEALAAADYTRFFAALLPFSVLYFGLDALVLWAVMRWFHGPIAYADLLPVRAVDYLVSILNHKLSQGAMVLYLSRKLSAPILEITSTILMLDLLQKTHLLLWATAGMIVLASAVPAQLFWVPLAALGVWVLLLAYLRGGIPVPAILGQPRQWSVFRSFRIAPLKRFLHVLLLKAPLLLAATVVHWLALPSFGIQISWPALAATLPIIFLVGALPVTIAHLGTAQAAWLFFHGKNVDDSALLAYSLAAHLTFMLANALLGLGFLPRAYVELGGGARERRPAYAHEGLGAPRFGAPPG